MTFFNALAVLTIFFLLITTAMSGKVTNPSRVPKNAALLSKISSLTLRNGKLTSSRRAEAVPQLLCVGPKEICKLYDIDVMRCVNEGADYDADNIQWSCKASLPEEFKLGSTDVICEGYESIDDPYVLKGSCGVEYRLLLTDKGEQKYSKVHQEYGWKSSLPNTNFNRGVSKMPDTIFGFLFLIIFVGVLFIILKGIWSQWNQNPTQPRRPRPYGGGNNGGGDDPPPPYDDGPPSYYTQPRRPKTQTPASKPGTSTRASSSRTSAESTRGSQGWSPGFWTGTAAGAAAGYLAGNRRQTRNETTQPETQQRPGGLFSGFGAPRQQAQGPAASAPLSSESSSSSPNYSSTRYESTGFGSTRRR